MLKKTAISLLIVLILANFWLCNSVHAKTMEAFNELQEGKVTTKSDGTSQTDRLDSQGEGSTALTIIAALLTPIPLSLQAILTLAIMPEQVTKIQLFTIEDLLLNRFDLFNVNYFDVDNVIGASNEGQVPSNTNKIIKQSVAEWFYAIRNFAIVALFAVLIAIGILMAVSSIASDRARYKKMLIDWVVSFAILMFLPYIMSITFTVSETAVTIIRDVSASVMGTNNSDARLEQSEGINFEKTLIFGKVDKKGNNYDGLVQKIQKSLGSQALATVIVYCVLVYYQIKFFILYLKRLLSVGFLIVISPLITITYSIDKARDNQAQAYKTWIKEFLVNVFIQPLHAFIFVIFMTSIYGVMEKAPLLAIIFLASLSRGEQIVRNIFKIERTSSMGFLGKKRGR